jgi:hypothetical protein
MRYAVAAEGSQELRSRGLPWRNRPRAAAPRHRGATRAARRPLASHSATAVQANSPPGRTQIEQSKSHVPIIAARQRLRRTRSSAPATEFLAPTPLRLRPAMPSRPTSSTARDKSRYPGAPVTIPGRQ